MGSAESKDERIARRIAERCISHEKNRARQLSKEEHEMYTEIARYQALYKLSLLEMELHVFIHMHDLKPSPHAMDKALLAESKCICYLREI